MRLFSGIKDTYKKSEAAVIVQNLLDMQVNGGVFDGDPASTATSLIGAVWDETPHLFDGRFGQRPHKLSVAAAALTKGASELPVGNMKRYPFLISLGNILNEVSVNGNLYPFNSLDAQLIESASNLLSEAMKEFNESQIGQDIASLIKDAN